MSDLATRNSALPSVERARTLLAACATDGEVKKIRAIAQAVATLERGKEIACDAGEIIVLADTRRAQLEAEERAARQHGGNRKQADSSVRLKEKDRKAQDRRAPLLQLPEKDQAKYFAECRKKLVPPTSMGAAALGKLSEPRRKEALAKLGDVADVRKVVAEAKRADRVEKLVAIAKGDAPLTVGPKRFPIVYADPPWRYEHVKTDNRAIENQYPTMDLDAICKLPLNEITTPDAVLFLWVTSPKLEEGMRVVAAWGFTYRTCAVWDKEKIGMGYYFRQQHELLLVCAKGSPPTPIEGERVGSVIRERRGDHSAKPIFFYELIERMYPELPKVELFARAPRAGWSAWGNQSKGRAA